MFCISTSAPALIKASTANSLFSCIALICKVFEQILYIFLLYFWRTVVCNLPKWSLILTWWSAIQFRMPFSLWRADSNCLNKLPKHEAFLSNENFPKYAFIIFIVGYLLCLAIFVWCCSICMYGLSAPLCLSLFIYEEVLSSVSVTNM